jgi:hypothetical protein
VGPGEAFEISAASPHPDGFTVCPFPRGGERFVEIFKLNRKIPVIYHVLIRSISENHGVAGRSVVFISSVSICVICG